MRANWFFIRVIRRALRIRVIRDSSRASRIRDISVCITHCPEMDSRFRGNDIEESAFVQFVSRLARFVTFVIQTFFLWLVAATPRCVPPRSLQSDPMK
jgi:hypothetical protein